MGRDYSEAASESEGVRAYYKTAEGRAALAAKRGQRNCTGCSGWSAGERCRFCGQSFGLCEAAAVQLEAAGYSSAAELLRKWSPVRLDPVDERHDQLTHWLGWLEGALEVAGRHAAHECSALSAAYDAIEAELDQIEAHDAKARGARHVG